MEFPVANGINNDTKPSMAEPTTNAIMAPTTAVNAVKKLNMSAFLSLKPQ
jgi:hypothetical protein